MTKLQVQVRNETAEYLAAEAADRGTSLEDMAAEVLNEHASSLGPSAGRFAFIGMGQAKPGFSARQAEELMEAEGFP